MPNFFVFAGTTEGRRLVEFLSRCEGTNVCAGVATEYGKTLLPEGVQVFAERLDAEGMASLLQSLRFDCVVDATHPYAALATENIRAACAATDTRYLRLSRPSNTPEGCVYVESAERAAEVLAATTGKVLLTTGSKELDAFVRVPGYQERIYPRVLPTVESVQRCLALGFRVQNVIAMQGPFSREMNGATMRQIGASILVTKESGDAGGFSEKLGAARDAGAVAVVIGRPREESGLPYEDAVEALIRDFALRPADAEAEPAAYFPLFSRLSNCKIALFGGGAAALSSAAALLPFCPGLVVITPQPSAELESLGVQIVRRAYMKGACAGCRIVIAATDNPDVDQAICEEARAAGIPADVPGSPELCDFYLPALLRRGGVVVGVSAGVDEKKRARKIARELSGRLDQILPGPEADHRE